MRPPCPSSPEAPAIAGITTSTTTVRKSSTISQPTAMVPATVLKSWASSRARMRTTVLATERAMPRTSPAVERPPEGEAGGEAEQRRAGALHEGAGDRDPLHREEVLRVEVQAHAEHEEHDADLGELGGEGGVGHEAGGVGPDDDAREQIAHDRGEPQALGEAAQDPGAQEGGGDRGDERGVVRHRARRLSPGRGRGARARPPLTGRSEPIEWKERRLQLAALRVRVPGARSVRAGAEVFRPPRREVPEVREASAEDRSPRPPSSSRAPAGTSPTTRRSRAAESKDGKGKTEGGGKEASSATDSASKDSSSKDATKSTTTKAGTGEKKGTA